MSKDAEKSLKSVGKSPTLSDLLSEALGDARAERPSMHGLDVRNAAEAWRDLKILRCLGVRPTIH